jgi:hypothetical protein
MFSGSGGIVEAGNGVRLEQFMPEQGVRRHGNSGLAGLFFGWSGDTDRKRASANSSSWLKSNDDSIRETTI